MASPSSDDIYIYIYIYNNLKKGTITKVLFDHYVQIQMSHFSSNHLLTNDNPSQFHLFDVAVTSSCGKK